MVLSCRVSEYAAEAPGGGVHSTHIVWYITPFVCPVIGSTAGVSENHEFMWNEPTCATFNVPTPRFVTSSALELDVCTLLNVMVDDTLGVDVKLDADEHISVKTTKGCDTSLVKSTSESMNDCGAPTGGVHLIEMLTDPAANVSPDIGRPDCTLNHEPGVKLDDCTACSVPVPPFDTMIVAAAVDVTLPKSMVLGLGDENIGDGTAEHTSE